MAELIHVKRDSTDIPFGFKIQGDELLTNYIFQMYKRTVI